MSDIMIDDMFNLTKDKVEYVIDYIRKSTDEELDDFEDNNLNIFPVMAIIIEMMDKDLKPSQFKTYVDMKFINAYKYIKNKSE